MDGHIHLDRDDMAIELLGLDLLDRIVCRSYRVHGQRRPRVRPATASAHKDSTDAAKTLLAARFRSRLSLDDVARAFHCSRFHLARLFRRQAGRSIHECQNRLRMMSHCTPLGKPFISLQGEHNVRN